MFFSRSDVRDTDHIFTATCPFDIRLTLALQEYGPVHIQHAECPGQKCGRVVKDRQGCCSKIESG